MAEPTGPDPSAGAAPSEPQPGAAVQPGSTTPAGFAPISALTAEQANTTRAREESATLRAHLELAGYRFDGEGRPVAPQPQPPAARPVVNPDEPPAEFVEAYNAGDPTGMWKVMRQATQADLTTRGLQTIAPLLGGAAEQHKERVVRDAPWLRPHMDDYDKVSNQLLDEAGITDPSLRNYYRATPALQGRVKSELVSRHIDAYADWKSKPGRVVGSFSEGPAGGTMTEAPASLSPEAQEIASRWGVSPEDQAKAAALRASGRGTVR